MIKLLTLFCNMPSLRVLGARRLFADIAQLVEQLIRNEQVVGSSPTIGSIFFPPPSSSVFSCQPGFLSSQPRPQRSLSTQVTVVRIWGTMSFLPWLPREGFDASVGA